MTSSAMKSLRVVLEATMALISDPLYGLDRERETYAPLDAALLARICAA